MKTDKNYLKILSEKMKKLKKEDFIVFVLIGILLIILALPTEEQEKTENSFWDFSGNRNEGTMLNEAGQKDKSDEGILGSMDLTADSVTADSLQAETSIPVSADVNNNICYDTRAYTEYMETKLENMLTSMEGAGEVDVMITVSATGEAVPLKDIPESTSEISEEDASGGTRVTAEQEKTEVTIYTEDGDGNRVPYVVQIRLPEVTGVLVMAQGAGNANVKQNIIDAVEVLFPINEHRIRVIRMKS